MLGIELINAGMQTSELMLKGTITVNHYVVRLLSCTEYIMPTHAAYNTSSVSLSMGAEAHW